MTTSTDELTAKAQEFRDRHGLPGIAAAIVTADGIQATALGLRARGRKDPVGPDDKWHIGSCGKSLTAALFARLVEGGRATWQDTVSQLFRDTDPHPAWDGVTITDLLTHFAGVPANLTQARMRAAYRNSAPGAVQRTEAARRVFAKPPVKYGQFLYSNLGYTLAGAAIERITGLSYEDALWHEVLDPLGMSSAGFGAPSGDQPRGHPPRWILYGKGKPIEPTVMRPPIPADNPPVITPAGRLHVALADWARFIRLFLADGGSLLSADSVQRITTPPAGRKSDQGMGWAVPAGDPAPFAYEMLGSNLRWVAAAKVDRDRRRAVLIATNDGRMRLFQPILGLGLELLT
jgi:D-alanyl-D-alanine carboxypeptidase